MGTKQLPHKSGEFLFEIIVRWYELKGTMMTSNRPLEDLVHVFSYGATFFRVPTQNQSVFCRSCIMSRVQFYRSPSGFDSPPQLAARVLSHISVVLCDDNGVSLGCKL
jgi:hypothetical protein